MKLYCNFCVIIFVILGTFVCISEDAMAVPAFPGAQGFGAVSVGGRGGEVYKVATLSSGEEEGSLRWALDKPGPKIIVFDVSGVIELDGSYDLSHTTIAGQTAPGAGITIKGQIKNSWSGYTGTPWPNIIMRFLRVRYDGPIDSKSDCIMIANVHKSIFDHVDVAWGGDELIDMNAANQNTIQWSAIVEGDPEGRNHHYGIMFAYGSQKVTMHHNLLAHNIRRNPYNGAEMFEHINNVTYNFEAGFHWYGTTSNGGDPYDTNTIGNYFKDGPDYDRMNIDGWVHPAYTYAKSGDWYQSGNYFDWVAKYYNDPAKGYVDLFDNDLPSSVKKTPYNDAAGDSIGTIKRYTPFIVDHSYPVTIQDAQEAYESVLEKAGCLPHDWVMKRITNEVRTGTGSWGRVDPPNGDLMYGLTPGTAPVDTDKDGMPDDWETSHGLDPNNYADHNNIVPAGVSENDRHQGYTYIEYYINELADNLHAAVTEPPVIPSPPQSLRIIP